MKIVKYFTEYAYDNPDMIVDHAREEYEFDQSDREAGETLEDAKVRWALDVIYDCGATEASSSEFTPGVWYSGHQEWESPTRGTSSDVSLHIDGPINVLRRIFREL